MKTLIIQIPLTANDTGPIMLSWVTNCFLNSICENYIMDAPRRVEAYHVAIEMARSAFNSNQISKDEFQEIIGELNDVINSVFPKSGVHSR